MKVMGNVSRQGFTYILLVKERFYICSFLLFWSQKIMFLEIIYICDGLMIINFDTNGSVGELLLSFSQQKNLHSLMHIICLYNSSLNKLLFAHEYIHYSVVTL